MHCNNILTASRDLESPKRYWYCFPVSYPPLLDEGLFMLEYPPN